MISIKDKIKYRYRFGNEKWNDMGYEPKLSLIKLSPGKYDIEVEARDNLNSNSIKKVGVKLMIIPVFYKTTLFYILCFVVFGFIVFSINRYMIREERQKGILKKKIKENENKLLRSQMNPHFLFNSLNSINSFIILNKKDEASDYLTSFSKLMRKILDNSGKEVISLKEELDSTKLYMDLEAARLEHKFDYSITVDKSLDTKEITIPPLILQPFLENAIWHGINPKKGKGFIQILIVADKTQSIKIKIKDDGIGRVASGNRKRGNSHTSKGIDITIGRIKMNDAKNTIEIIDLYTDKGQAAGTLVDLKIAYI